MPAESTQAVHVTEEPSIKSSSRKAAEVKPPRPEEVIVAMTPAKEKKIVEEPAVSEAAEKALAKLMDQGKFTDTLDQLNKAVSQKEKLEAKLQRIKEKIKQAKNIRKQPDSVAKSSERVPADKSSAPRPSATVSDVNTSDIYMLMKGAGSAVMTILRHDQSSEAPLNEGMDRSVESYDRRSKPNQPDFQEGVTSFATKVATSENVTVKPQDHYESNVVEAAYRHTGDFC